MRTKEWVERVLPKPGGPEVNLVREYLVKHLIRGWEHTQDPVQVTRGLLVEMLSAVSHALLCLETADQRTPQDAEWYMVPEDGEIHCGTCGVVFYEGEKLLMVKDSHGQDAASCAPCFINSTEGDKQCGMSSTH